MSLAGRTTWVHSLWFIIWWGKCAHSVNLSCQVITAYEFNLPFSSTNSKRALLGEELWCSAGSLSLLPFSISDSSLILSFGFIQWLEIPLCFLLLHTALYQDLFGPHTVIWHYLFNASNERVVFWGWWLTLEVAAIFLVAIFDLA